MRSWSRIIVHGARECAHDYAYYNLAIRSSLSIRHVKLVARQWRCPIVCPVSKISPAYGCIESVLYLETRVLTPEEIDGDDWAPIHHAIYGGSLELIRYLVDEKGASICSIIG